MSSQCCSSRDLTFLFVWLAKSNVTNNQVTPLPLTDNSNDKQYMSRMGFHKSLSVSNFNEQVHKVDPIIAPLGSEHGAGPSMDSSTQLLVREHLFRWSKDIKIKTRGGAPFGNDLKIRGKEFGVRGQMVLVDGNNMPVAVCWRKSMRFGKTFKIYSTQPLYHGQKPSDRKYNQYDLYTHAKVDSVPLSTVQQVTYANESSPSYTIHRAGGLGSKTRIVKLNGRPAALMEGGLREQGNANWNSCLVTINPGIDPCLIVCLSAVCDEMDDDRQHWSQSIQALIHS